MYYPLIFYYSKNVIHSLHFVKLREKLYENKNVYVHINFFNIYTFILTYKTLIVIRRKKNRLLTSFQINFHPEEETENGSNKHKERWCTIFIHSYHVWLFSSRESRFCDSFIIRVRFFRLYKCINLVAPISIHAFALPFPLKKRTL